MNLIKQIFFSGLSALLLFSFTVQAADGQPFATRESHIPKDTTVKKDAATENNVPVSDPKLGFKNLFTTAVTGDGINGARLNPLAIRFVENYINKNQRGLDKMKDWGKPYFDLMDDILEEHGVPKELKYLAVIESGLKATARSWAGAVGPWAFMPAAAREYGLQITKNRDDRLDYFKSTHAAASYLTDLYTIYGDWLLVIAAYNSGPGNVNKAIRNSGGTKDFWKLQYNLPNESMNHVKKFIATHYIFEGEGGITTLTKSERKDYILNNSVNLKEDEMANSTAYKITGRFNSGVIIKYVDMDIASFLRYNPGFDNEIANNGTYELRLPLQKMNSFVSKRYQILDESMQLLLNPSMGTNK